MLGKPLAGDKPFYFALRRRRHRPYRPDLRKRAGEAHRDEGQQHAGLRDPGGAHAHAIEAHVTDLVGDDLAQSLFHRVAKLAVVPEDDASLLEQIEKQEDAEDLRGQSERSRDGRGAHGDGADEGAKGGRRLVGGLHLDAVGQRGAEKNPRVVRLLDEERELARVVVLSRQLTTSATSAGKCTVLTTICGQIFSVPKAILDGTKPAFPVSTATSNITN